MTSNRGLRTGDLVRLPGRDRPVVVESVSLDEQWFTDTYGASHGAQSAEQVPLAAAA